MPTTEQLRLILRDALRRAQGSWVGFRALGSRLAELVEALWCPFDGLRDLESSWLSLSQPVGPSIRCVRLLGQPVAGVGSVVSPGAVVVARQGGRLQLVQEVWC